MMPYGDYYPNVSSVVQNPRELLQSSPSQTVTMPSDVDAQMLPQQWSPTTPQQQEIECELARQQAAEVDEHIAAIRRIGCVPCTSCIERNVKYPGNLAYCTNCHGLGWTPKPRHRVKAKSQRWTM